MRTKLKLMLVLASLGALAALAMSGPALAGGTENPVFAAGDPMTTNVPYVAWAGEEVRLVKCIDDEEGFWEGTDAEWGIVDSSVRQRSGELRDPVFFDDTDRRTADFAGGGEQRGRTCWAIDVDSVNPGMTRIKMAVDGNEGTEGSPVLKHDFLVIWLAMSNPSLTELSNTAFPGYTVGDPLGDGNFTPVDGELENGLIRVRVTGSFVDLHGGARTLPADWASLAGRYAFDTSGYNPMAWDIHDDDLLGTDTHTATSMCGGTAAVDTVDNCLGGGERITRFSRKIGGTALVAGQTIGPFDPARPDSSLLADGKLDYGDAPMPAARIDLDLSGTVGALAAADKHVLYSRNRTGAGGTGGIAANNAHNLYAPFYVAVIPADVSNVLPGYTTSGTHGAIANNFPGYQILINEAYHYWDFLNISRRGGFNDCRDVGGDGQFGDDEDSGRIALPTGINGATVYTDEHGEAIAQFVPFVGADLTPDANGLCDLGSGTAPQLLGTATIQAEALDPFQLTFNDRRLSTPLTKNVFELASKSLDCYPKSNLISVCIETITDIWGNPVEGAPVVFSADGPGDPNVIGMGREFGEFAGSECPVSPGTSFGIFEGTLCFTNEDGQAGVEVLSSLIGDVNVIAENIATRNGGFGVLRDRCIHFSSSSGPLPTDGPSCANTNAPGPVTPPAPPSGNSGGGGGGTQSPIVPQAAAPQATVVSLSGPTVPAAQAPEVKKPAAKAAALKLTSARLVFKNGKRYLVVRVNGSAKTAKVRVTLVMRTGKVTKPVVRTIRTNAAVRVANLQVSKHVRTVRVALAK